MSADHASVRAAALLVSYQEEGPGRFVVRPRADESEAVRLLIGAGLVVPAGDAFLLTFEGAAAVVRFADATL